MSTWSETRMQFREVVTPAASGPLERLWHSDAGNTVFLSAAELERREDTLRNAVAAETTTRMEQEYESALAACRRELIHSLAMFEADRAAYFRDMEAEVVRLALAVGRTAVERELRIDPTLLEPIVRDTLQRMERGSKIKLRVPCSDVAAWQASLAMESDSTLRVEIVGDARLASGQCVIESALGTTEFDVGARLDEIGGALTEHSGARGDARPVSVQ